MNRNKVAKLDESVIQMLTDLDDSGFHKVIEVINEINNSTEIPEDLFRRIFIAFLRKP